MEPTPIVFKAVGAYIQGPGLVDRIGEYVAPLVREGLCLLVDQGVRFLQPRLEASLHGQNIGFFIQDFAGDLYLETVTRTAETIRIHRPQAVMGVGSGKAVDMSKMLAARLGAKNIVLATASSTDAPPSHSAVGLDKAGHISAQLLPRSPDLVLVDTEVVVSAPVRMFTAGIGDALSKKTELETAVALGENNFVGGRRPFFIDSMAETLHETLMSRSAEAKQDVERKRTTEAVQQVITACVLLSTLVWENGGLAGAHSIANVLFNSGSCRDALHGEQVAFGLLVQLLLQERIEELERLKPFYQDIGLPLCTADLGIDEEQIDEISTGIHQRWKKHHLDYSDRQIREAIETLT